MNLKFIGVSAGVASLLGAFMPQASAGNMFVGISHMGGISYLLYPLAIGALAIAVVSIYKPELAYLKIWTILLAVCGLALTAIVYSAAKSQVAYAAQFSGSMHSLFGNAGAATPQATANIGLGCILQLLGYAGLLTSSFLPGKTVATAAVLVILASLASPAVADDTSAKVNEMISDLGNNKANNGKEQKCIDGGTKKVTIKTTRNGTSYSGLYKKCREFGRMRDGHVAISLGG